MFCVDLFSTQVIFLFVGKKVFFMSCSSTILKVPPTYFHTCQPKQEIEYKSSMEIKLFYIPGQIVTVLLQNVFISEKLFFSWKY